MNIQPSVIIWTIICFFVLMFVLDRLLFRPMFAFMRARREKIEGAAAKRAQLQQQLADKAKAENENAAAEKRSAFLKSEEALAEALKDADDSVAAARARFEQELAESKENIVKEKADIEAALEASLTKLATTFAEKLVS